MSGSKQLFIIEDAIMDATEKLYYFKETRNKNSYKLALATLELLDYDYKELSGEHYFKNNEILNYYAKLWEL